jgi:hypothetical protein
MSYTVLINLTLLFLFWFLKIQSIEEEINIKCLSLADSGSNHTQAHNG